MVVHLGPVTRIRELDALRGFAVGGIMLVNTWQHTEQKPRVPLDWTIEALFQSIRNWIAPNVELIELDMHVNDPAFAAACAGKLLEYLKRA